MTLKGGRLVARVKLERDRDVARARQTVSQAFDAFGSSAIHKTRFVTAVSEIARNAVTHGGGGEIAIYAHEGPARISIVCTDLGPGIEDTEQAMRDGFSTTKSMGRGLGGARRLTKGFEIETAPGRGTTVRMWGVA